MDSKSALCVANNGKDKKYNRHVSRRVDFLRNGEKCRIQNIYWFEGGMQLEDIATSNVG